MRTLANIIDALPSEVASSDLKTELKCRLNGQALHVWQTLCSLLQNEKGDTEHDPVPKPVIEEGRGAVVRSIAIVLLNEDSLSWGQRIEWCETPEDFRAFFASLGVKEEQWRVHTWLVNKASKPVEEGGIGRSLGMIVAALKIKFGSHSQFVAWIDGKAQSSLCKRVEACVAKEDYLALFRDLGIPGEEWKNSRWLERTSGLSPEEGGIGLKLAHLVQYIRQKKEFGSFPQFVAWMEGKQKPDDYLTVRIGACKEPSDFFALFRELGIPDNEWENTKWLCETARLPMEEGGIGKTLVGLCSAIRKDKRFGNHRKFVAWMYGKDEPEPYMTESVRACRNPAEFLQLFARLGISEEQWRSSEWLCVTSKLSPEQGGVGKSMSGLLGAFRSDKRFKGLSKFVAWMDGKSEPPKSWPKKVSACQTRNDFLLLFEESGISGDKWKNSNWLSLVAKRPPEEGGIGKHLAGLAQAITADARFQSYVAFVAWMEERELQPVQSWSDRVAACKTREDFLQMFAAEGVPGDKWKIGNWFPKMARLPAEEGGAGKSLSKLLNAIRDDPRFLSYPRFVRWMEGEELSQDFAKVKRLSFIDRVKACQVPDDFRRYFIEIGVPGEAWRNSTWFAKSKLSPEEGGVGKNLSGLGGAIRRDGRFKSYKDFVAWMDGKQERELNNRERVERCKTPGDFLALFIELGVPGDKWRERDWFTSIAKLPQEQGGIGKTGLSSLPDAIVHDSRFGSFPQFIAWMDGKEKAEDPLAERARNCQTRDDFLALFKELGVPSEKWKNGQWLREGSKKSPEEGGIGRCLVTINHQFVEDHRFGSQRKFVAWMEGREELDNGVLAAEVHACQTQEDFLALFERLEITGGKWRSYPWLVRTAALPVEQGGIGRAMEGMTLVIRERFASYEKFVAWMDGEKQPKDSWKQRVKACETPEDFHMLFDEIGVPGNKWRVNSWLQRDSILSPEEGGIGIPLQGLAIAVRERFGGHPQFVAWMIGKEKPDPSFRSRVQACSTREDFLALFVELGISGDLWKNNTWRCKTARLPVEEGGIGRNLSSFAGIIADNTQFDSFAHFVAWMEGKDAPPLSFPKRMAICQTREDFLQWFKELGITGELWKDGSWLAKKAKLPPEEGGIGRNMTALMHVVRADERFGSYPQFIAWMEGREKAEESMPKRVANCKTPEDFLRLFAELGIPDQKWRSTNWMRNTAKLTVEEGGVGKNFATLCSAIRLDQRFGGYRQFVAWMDGKEKPDPTMMARVRSCQTRQDFLMLFSDLGIPDGAWRRSNWLSNIAKLPLEQGGIGKNLSSLAGSIQADERFKSYRHFVALMDDRIPWEGIQDESQMFIYADKEIIRLKKRGRMPHGFSPEEVTAEDYDFFFRMSNVDKNIVLRVIEEFMEAASE